MARLRLRGSILLLVVLLLISLPAVAGITYTSVSTIQAANGAVPASGHEMRTEVWVSNGNAKLQFVGSSNPLLPQGSYMLKRADNAAMLLVSPEKKTWAVWDMAAVMAGLGKSVKSMFRIEDAKWQKVGEEDGGEVSGYPTRHFHFRFDYTMVLTVEGKELRVPATTDQETWTTDKIADPGLKSVLDYQYVNQLAGLSPELEQMVRAELADMKGFPLKDQWTMSMEVEGKPVTQNITTTISEIKTVDIPDSVFAVPPDYTQTTPPSLGLPKEDAKVNPQP